MLRTHRVPHHLRQIFFEFLRRIILKYLANIHLTQYTRPYSLRRVKLAYNLLYVLTETVVCHRRLLVWIDEKMSACIRQQEAMNNAYQFAWNADDLYAV